MWISGTQIVAQAVRSRLRHSFRLVAGGETMRVHDAEARFWLRDSAGTVQLYLSSPAGTLALEPEYGGQVQMTLDRLALRQLRAGATYRYDLLLIVAGQSLRVRGPFVYRGDIAGA